MHGNFANTQPEFDRAHLHLHCPAEAAIVHGNPTERFRPNQAQRTEVGISMSPTPPDERRRQGIADPLCSGHRR
ncbi:MAG TPA: hypothetical protein VK993_03675, partial [Chthoniobacterales bacterium]|nr:hypothetical protein [Chthoniobacterales bacterium]